MRWKLEAEEYLANQDVVELHQTLEERDKFDSKVDSEVEGNIDRGSRNNNATVNAGMGECSYGTKENKEREQAKACKMKGWLYFDENDKIEDRVHKSLDSMHNYIKRKFADLQRVKDLENELMGKQRQLDKLREKCMYRRKSTELRVQRGQGQNCENIDNMDDGQSELTIYQNAVWKLHKRDSSSSDEPMNISDETHDGDDTDNIDHVYFPE